MYSILFAAAVASNPPSSTEALLQQAAAAYSRFDVGAAERLYEDVLVARAVTSTQAATARRELARIAWIVDGRGGRARALLRPDLRPEPEACPSIYLYARIATADDVRWPRQLDELRAYCQEIEPGISLEQVRHLMVSALRQAGVQRSRSLALALKRLDQLPIGARTSASGNRLRLAIGLHQGAAQTALEGWTAYFWLEPGESLPQGLRGDFKNPRRIFEAGLVAHAAGDDRDRLLILLLRAGFAEEVEALRLARGAGVGPETALLIDAYLELRRGILRETLQHDRRYARSGPGDETGYERRLGDLLENAARKMAPEVSDVPAVLRREFNLLGTAPGRTNGVPGVHLGHVVVDEQQLIVQGSRRGAIRFVALDNMIHNSFSAWLMDGRSAPGGWAADGKTIIQVRPVYLQSIDSYARLASGGLARREAEIEAARLTAADRHTAQANPVSFLPGVRARLRLQGIDQLAAKVRASSPTPSNFDQAFRKAYWDALVASSITAHEGRHVLDQASYGGKCALSNEELEFRAKLSEIRYAPIPRLAISSIYSPLLGGESGHGIANLRLMTSFANWMESRRTEVVGYRIDHSPLEQLDLLSDEQLVEIASFLEPKAGPCPVMR